MLIEINPDWYAMKRFESEEGLKVGGLIADWARQTFEDPALLIFVAGAGSTLNSDKLLEGLFADNNSLPVFGGLSSMPPNEGRPRFSDGEGIGDAYMAVAGVIGKRKFTYDLWGDTANVASRMESTGLLPGRVQLSDATYQYLKDAHEFESRGEIEIKGKGKMKTWLVAAAEN